MLADVVKYCQVNSQRPKVKEDPNGDADFWHQAWDVALIVSQDTMKGGVVTMTHVPEKVLLKRCILEVPIMLWFLGSFSTLWLARDHTSPKYEIQFKITFAICTVMY